MSKKIYHLIGVGSGVFNLSLSVLLEEQNYSDAIFFERNTQINWHPGLLLETSELQVSFLKDLILPVSPTSRFTFLNYLNHRNLLYQFLNRKSDTISRNQFQAYFRWVSEQLSMLKMGHSVESIGFNGELFEVKVNGELYLSRNISIAAGIKERLHDFVKPYIGDDVFHVSQYAQRKECLKGKRVVVVGNGQSSAEIFADLINDNNHESLSWLGRRFSFAQLEDNCFINEFYGPSFVNIFKSLSNEKKSNLLNKLAMSSDGINQGLLNEIYRKIYERKFFSDKDYKYLVRPNHELTKIDKINADYRLTFNNLLSDESFSLDADKVILGTGFSSASWELIKDVISDEYQTVDELIFNDNFELNWKHSNQNKIYLQNTSKMSIGLADPNLSISAYRAAMIANSILEEDVYCTTPDTPLVEYM